LKGGAPIEVKKLHVDRLGIADDRRWAVVDMSKASDSRVLTTRTHPKMSQIVPSFPDPEEDPRVGRSFPLTLNAPGMPTLEAPRPNTGAWKLDLSLWGVPGVALDCGDASSKWLSEFLGGGEFRLAYMSDVVDSTDFGNLREMRKQEAWADVYPEGTKVGFADSTHLSLISEASLHDVATRLANKGSICPERFRMNVVLSGTSAYEEELWKIFEIDSVVFEVARLCNRCAVTLVNPATGEKGPLAGEPVNVLRTYRRHDQLWRVDPRHGAAPILGTKACTHFNKGTISVGDAVTVQALRTRSDRRY